MKQESTDHETVIEIIDRGRTELESRVNNLRSAIRHNVCRYTIDNALDCFEKHVEDRFRVEEDSMECFNYPGSLLHKAAHDQFVEELNFLREELRNIRAAGLKGSYELSVETVQLVTDWLSDHVKVEDKALETFLRQLKYSDDEVGFLSLMSGQ